MKTLLYRLRKYVPRPVRFGLHRVGKFFGDEFALYSPQFGGDEFPSVHATLEAIRGKGFRPTHIVDVGAFRGDWARFAKDLFPDARVLMIEPQEEWRLQLEDVCRYTAGVTLVPALVGATDGVEVSFSEMSTGSSVFDEQSNAARRRATKTLTTLRTILNGAGWDRVDLLKIDVQGYELEVLRGAADYLDRCECVLVECSLIPTNTGCPLVSDVIAFMVAHDFRLLDICSLVRRRDLALWQTDLLFVKNNSALVPSTALDAANWM